MRRRALAVVVGAVSVVAACSSGGVKKAGGSTGTTASPAASSKATRRQGGSITVGVFSETQGLDPVVGTPNSGCCGGSELAAIYDTIMAFDHTTGTYVPRTAASLTPNAEQTDWVLKLKPNIEFADGTPYDAAAVKFNLERMMSTPAALPRPILVAFIESLTVIDPLALDIKLKRAWAGVPNELSHSPGMIASPTAIQKLGAAFNIKATDAGAGPFIVDSYTPHEALVLKRNPNFYGGTVYLDQIRFIPTTGQAAAELAVKAGNIQAAPYLFDPDVVAQAKADGLAMESILSLGANDALLNGGQVPCQGGAPATVCAGKPDGTIAPLDVPTKDVTVRRAVAAAIDPKVINDRVYSGKGDPSSALFPPGLRWNVGVAGPAYNLNQAKQLVAQAKSNGWDGKIRVTGNNTPEGTTWTEAVSAMLEAAGMTVTPDASKTIADQTVAAIRRNFDVIISGLSLPADQTDRIYEVFYLQETTATYRWGYGSADMDVAVDALRTANNDQLRTAALKKIATVLARDVPLVSIENLPTAFVHSPRLHGAVMSNGWIELFDKAWIEG